MENKIALQGICYDSKSSFLKGTAKAPPLIRDAYRSDSANFFAENGLEIGPQRFHDHGDHEVSSYFDIETLTTTHLKEDMPLITLGGDHSISFPVLKAFNALHGPLTILHLDAHADLYDKFEGDPYSHACPFARVMEYGLAKRLVQLGIRTFSTHQREQAKKFSMEVIEMNALATAEVPQFQGPIYLSLDIDVLDPAFAPGVSHHEPGGLSTRQLLDIIQGLKVPLIGADIVEYNPSRDIQGTTGMVCAKLLKEIAAKMLEQSHGRNIKKSLDKDSLRS